ncbi:hypothetical protein NOV72_02735 [Caballeronia novacaledonica]|uniref:Uncharacterized protein n=1 Tax=Caballeronia novacaledonica TaxID=1544861 RepID=A0A2U3I5X9_9BURK|nr:hypothetical protein [Caballeronia novacaledonica]SPB15515.1 hypothetical protein NOV72_02735 [Caballeronia novacaledonica]
MNDVGITLRENAKSGLEKTDRAFDFANVWHGKRGDSGKAACVGVSFD